MSDQSSLESIFEQMLEATRLHISNIKPSEWYEANMVMPLGSAFPGPFRFNLTPFWREPLDCAGKDHPAKEISIMKGAQLGGTAAVLNPIVGYTIAQNPGHMMFLTGHTELSEAAFVKIDAMIDNCGIRSLIRPTVKRAKNSRSGDTGSLKEYSGGELHGGSVTNHNLLRQYDIMIMIVDDFDAAPMSSKAAGATRELVQKRTNAFAHKKKIFYVSSPQLKGMSNIENVFLLGDQRYYNVPCPNCGTYIVLKWEIEVNEFEKAGIHFETDENGHLIRKSVCYICQSCSKSFTDRHKYEMNLAGMWVPTVKAIEENHWSYQISGLYAPPGMDDWAHYAQQYLNANPKNGIRKEKKHQTFLNVDMGEPYEKSGDSVDVKILMKNQRPYTVGTVPEKLSMEDGNGRIIILTCACDLNGTEKDARLDYEIVAWSETGCSYSVTHGSIGTFIPKENSLRVKEDRERWTYEPHRPTSVWPELTKILSNIYMTDSLNPTPEDRFNIGRKMQIAITGIDTGHYTEFAYGYIDKANTQVIGLKGDKESKFRKLDADTASFRPSKERGKLWLVDVNFVKDQLAEEMKFVWDKDDRIQPVGFMNFPKADGGKYQYENFFSHFEAEHSINETKDGEDIGSRWVKKASHLQNHMFDCRVYNNALRDILVHLVTTEMKIKRGTWADFRRVVFGN